MPIENNRILVIDDNPAIHADFRKILCDNSEGAADLMEDAAALFGTEGPAQHGRSFEIGSAYQGQEGFAMIEAAADAGQPYALAFVDVRMPPGWDGVETIARIWEKHPDVQIVICTAYSDHSWEEIVERLGNKESLLILKKPFDHVEVLQMAHALTEKWSLTHELKTRLNDLESLVKERTADLETANDKLRAEAAERELAQAELKRSQEQFAKAFHANPVAIAIQLASERKFIDVNEGFLSLTGYSREEALGATSHDLQLHSDQGFESKIETMLRSGDRVRNLVAQIRGKTGACREVLVSAEPVRLGERDCVLMILADVTEQRRLEEKFRRGQKLQAVGQLAAGIAHNFNNILAIIEGHASMQLLDTTLPKPIADSLEQIVSASDRAANMVRQLLTVSRQQDSSDDRPLDLNAIVSRTCELLRPVIGENIHLVFVPNPRLPAVLGDESGIEQVLMNLAVNARHAMDGRGAIRFDLKETTLDESHGALSADARSGRFVQLSVSDSGCGMDAETLAHLFEPFFTTKDVGEGSGLGLATVHGIVTQHDGWIEVTSKPGVGTTFDVFLPPVESAASPVETTVAAETASRGGGETILVVEDEPSVRRVVGATLESRGYRVLKAEDAADALRIMDENRYEVDLLLTDILMPGGMTGADLATQLRKRKPALPIIFSSGYSPDSALKSVDQTGVTFLSKPYTARALLEAVRDSV